MPRTRPDNRLDQLVAAAVTVFTQKGYRRTQMADVARSMGVSPGTLYLYVESKEALFDLVVQRAFSPHPGAAPRLPIPTPKPAATLRRLRQRMAEETRLPQLDAALRHRHVDDPAAELADIVREYYGIVERHHRGIRLLERSALDWPELASVFYRGMRRDVLDRLTRYLELRARHKLLRAVTHPQSAARFINEAIAWFGMHRHNDLDSTHIGDREAQETVVDLIVHALTVPDRCDRPVKDRRRSLATHSSMHAARRPR
ncbi:MAG: TetR/AcrR family transcriptional regulator [Deltaproteobacteria bacterium]|nr:TetR/AcrR family transcriptional regulator [Deltaproteobacteria bacterium]